MPPIMKLLGIATVAFLAIFALDSFGVFRSLFNVGEPGIRDIVNDKYPEYDPTLEHMENCTICDESGCRTYPGPCWKITVITEGEDGKTLVTMVMDESGGILEQSESPCNMWWCDAYPCRRTYTEQTDQSSTTYVNMDCGLTNGTCDQEFGRCRPCETGEDCIAEITTANSSSTTYRFEVLGTGEYAEISSSDPACRIFSRGAKIFDQTMDVESCGDLMYGNTMCYDGSCDFVPGFDLIPI